VAMARFAQECMLRIQTLTRKLEVTFGPDTGELSMRMGMHSGPVTAGVLRGERSRFQLFGETVNMAARMESTGKRDKIQVSQDTADLLVAGGKAKWLSRREDGECPKSQSYSNTVSFIGSLTLENSCTSHLCQWKG
jgi:class 3 adenylate cyclase